MRIPFSPKWKRMWNCLNDAQLAAFVDGSLPTTERGRTEIHLSKCLRCRDAVALLLRSERQDVAGVPPAWMARVRDLGDRRKAPGSVRWAWAGGLACLVIVAMAVTFASRPFPQKTVAAAHLPAAPSVAAGPVAVQNDEVRNLGRPSTGPAVITPAEGAQVAHDLEVRWQPLAAAVSYEVRVLDAAGDTVWHTQTNADHLQIPADASLHQGRKYFVLIGANLPTGKTVHARAVSFKVEVSQENR